MGFNTKFLLALSIFSNNCCNSSNYKEYSLQRDKLCSKELSVGQGNRSSIIVKYLGEKDDLDGKKDFECTFFVKAHFEMGLFAVIQKMNLRRDKEPNNCTDYIKFRHGKKKPLGYPWIRVERKEWTSPICGKVENLIEPVTGSSEAVSAFKETELAPHAYQDAEGEIEIKLHISKQKIQDLSADDLFLVIAFTSYKECKADIGAYKRCSPNTCIYKDYFSDDVVNCPFVNCVDETKCPGFIFSDSEGSGLGTKVTITAVSSIFFSFFLFLGCIMLCRCMEIMCWSKPNPDRGTELSQVEPTAPPAPSSPDKDLPPAYETLFPEG